MSRAVTTRSARGTRGGMTLIEILVAMLVLLVGIYTVAKGFPALLLNIRGQGDRTIMGTLAQGTMEQFNDSSYGLPDAITGLGGGLVSPYSYPSDLNAPAPSPRTYADANALQDLTDVIGESFRVPSLYIPPNGTYAAGDSCIYVLRRGPAAWTGSSGTDVSGFPYVYLLVPLTEQMVNPNSSGQPGLAENSFYVDMANNSILVPDTVNTYEGSHARTWTVNALVADYAWSEAVSGSPPYPPPTVHYVQDETVDDIDTTVTPHVAKVHAAHLPNTVFGHLVPGQTRVWAKIYFKREPFGVSSPHAPGYYVLENKYGAVLKFDPADAGLTLKVDYRLRTDQQGRRLLMMTERHTIDGTVTRIDSSNNPYVDVRLALRHLDDGSQNGPLFGRDLLGNPLASPAHVLAIDLVTGQAYTDGQGLSLVDTNLSPPLDNGYDDGVLTMPMDVSGSPAEYIGHPLRFYYRTLNSNTVEVEKAPRAYVDYLTASSYQAAYLGYLGGNAQTAEPASLAEVDYRSYKLTMQPAPNDSSLAIGTIEFGEWLDQDNNPSTPPVWVAALSSCGMTVAVSYCYWVNGSNGGPPQPRFVWDELHTVSDTGHTIALNNATLADHPITVFAVNGVSARARAWWLGSNGSPQMIDMDSAFLPTALQLLPRVND